MDSYQFNDALLMGYSNQTNLTYNHTGQLDVYVNIECKFVELNAFQGYVNVSILDNVTEIWSYETSNFTELNETFDWNHSNNVTIRIRSVGSDSDPFSDFADWFIVTVEAEMISIG